MALRNFKNLYQVLDIYKNTRVERKGNQKKSNASLHSFADFKHENIPIFDISAFEKSGRSKEVPRGSKERHC